VATWGPEDRSYEVMGDEPPSRPDRRRLVVVLALGLLIGVVVGARSDLLTGAEADREPLALPRFPVRTVSVGSITPVEEQDADGGTVFELPVHNSGDDLVRVSVLKLGEWREPVLGDVTDPVHPGTWSVVTFRAPGECESRPAGRFRSVRLQVVPEGGGQAEEVTVPLPGLGQALVEYHETVCSPGTPLRRRDLVGVWLLESVHGSRAELAGELLVRFTADGTFLADPNGDLLSGDAAWRGRYQLDGAALSIRNTADEGRAPGMHTEWRLVARAGDRVALVQEGVECHEPRDVLVLRRVLDASGLPPAR
jgi:hypothetical protein